MDCTAHLPNEILCYIIHSARSVYPITTSEEVNRIRDAIVLGGREGVLDHELHRRYRQALLAWVVVTHVCTRWRTIALCDASLWMEIPFVLGVQWMDIFAARSKPLPIRIDWNEDAQYDGDCVYTRQEYLCHNIVPRHYERIRNLVAKDVCVLSGGNDAFFAIICHPWPELESADLQLWGHNFDFKLFDDNAPKLRQLSLRSSSRCHELSWMTRFLHHLTSLDIAFRCGIEASSMDSFLDTLLNIPGLQHLRLGPSSWPPSSEPAAPPCAACSSNRVVSKPLKTFSCYSSFPDMIHIMQHIFPSPSVRIHLEPIFSIRDTEDEVNGILPFLAAILPEWYRASLKLDSFTSAEISYDTCLQLRASRTMDFLSVPSERRESIDEHPPDLAIELTEVRGGHWEAPLMHLLQGLAPDGLRAVSLKTHHWNFVGEFRFSHPLFDTVQFLRLLAPYPELIPASEHFPASQVLDFHRCDLVAVLPGNPSNHVGWVPLEHILRERRRRIPLHVFCLRVREEIDAVFGEGSYVVRCAGVPTADIRQGISKLEAIEGVLLMECKESAPWELLSDVHDTV